MRKIIIILAALGAAGPAHGANALTLYSNATTYFQIFPSTIMPSNYSLMMPVSTGTVNQCLAVKSSSGSQTVMGWQTQNSGAITGVTAGLGLNGGGTSGTVTLNLSPGSTQYWNYPSTGTLVAPAIVASTFTVQNEIILPDGTVIKSTSTLGAISGVTAGYGLTGGGTSGNVTLNLNGATSSYWQYPSTGTLVDSYGFIGSSFAATTAFVMPDGSVLKSTASLVSSTASVTNGHLAVFSAGNAVIDGGAVPSATPPGGAGTQIQYRNGSAFGGVVDSSVTTSGPILSSATVADLHATTVWGTSTTLNLGGIESGYGFGTPFAQIVTAISGVNSPTNWFPGPALMVGDGINIPVNSPKAILGGYINGGFEVGAIALQRMVSFAHQGFYADIRSDLGDLFWQLPSSDANGFWQSNGSGILSIAPLTSSNMSALLASTNAWTAQQSWTSAQPSTFTYLDATNLKINGVAVTTNSWISGNQTITLTGPVTGSGTTSIATTMNLVSLSTGVMSSLPAASIAAGSLGASVLASSITLSAMYGAPTLTGTNITSIPAASINAGSLGASVIASSITLAAMYGAPTLTGTNITGIPATSISAGSLGASVLASSITLPALTGDVTTTAGGTATTLASIVTANQYGSSTVSPVITFDAKGRITAVSSATIAGGGGYAVQPATVTFQLNQGATASTMTVSSNTILSGATFYNGGPINLTAPVNFMSISTMTFPAGTAIDVSAGVLYLSTFTILNQNQVGALGTGTAIYPTGNTLTNASARFMVMGTSADSYITRFGTSTVGTDYVMAVTTNAFSVGGSTPTLSSCGTSPVIVGTNNAGIVTPGATASGCTITFVPKFKNVPACLVTEQTLSLVNVLSYTVSATALTVSQTSLSSVLNYHCDGIRE